VGIGTVKDADLAHTKSFFRWCKKNKKIPNNPFVEVSVDNSKSAPVAS
jgi:site-specific recombinase XerD